MARNGERPEHRVVVTGMGVLAPNGNNLVEFWDSLIEGRSGLGIATSFDVTDLPVKVVAELKNFDARNYMDFKEAKRMARFSQVGVAAAKMAIDQSGLELAKEDRTRIGCEVGTGIGGFKEISEEIEGFAVTDDAFHIVMPEEDGDGPARAMAKALEDAHVGPEDVDYINAHGTSTQLNDKSETAAIKRVMGDRAKRIPISSTKSMIGHLLGAAGAVEAIASILSINHGMVHPTINLEHPDPDCDLDYVPGGPRRHEIKVAMSNSFGFGGQNACIVLKRFDNN